MDEPIESIMLVIAACGALVGTPLGIWAWVRSGRYTGEQQRLLRMLGHHMLEPMITVGSACLAFLMPALVFVPLASVIALFAPLFYRTWEIDELKIQNRSLAYWAIARIGTCILVWVSLLLAPDLASGTAPFLPITTMIGTSVLWMSLVFGGKMLITFPAPTPAPATNVVPS